MTPESPQERVDAVIESTSWLGASANVVELARLLKLAFERIERLEREAER